MGRIVDEFDIRLTPDFGASYFRCGKCCIRFMAWGEDILSRNRILWTLTDEVTARCPLCERKIVAKHPTQQIYYRRKHSKKKRSKAQKLVDKWARGFW